MMKFIAFVLVLVGGYFFWKDHQQKARNPEVFTNPVYAEAMVKMEGNDRSVEGIIFVKAADKEDCKRLIADFEKGLDIARAQEAKERAAAPPGSQKSAPPALVTTT